MIYLRAFLLIFAFAVAPTSAALAQSSSSPPAEEVSSTFVNENSGFKCSDYDIANDVEGANFKAAIKKNFKLGDTKEEIEDVLIGRCGATQTFPNKNAKTLEDRRIVNYRLEKIKQDILIVYIDDKAWEIFNGVTRIWPEEPISLNIPQYETIPTIADIKKDPALFKFEYFPKKKDLIAAVQEIFSYGDSREFVEKVLVEGGHASIGNFTRQGADGRKIVEGKTYNYYLPTKDGREYNMALRRIQIEYDEHNRVHRAFTPTNEIVLSKGN